ncbi:MAG: DUF2800 domain-containing protein [Thermoanaerobaculia bacterium]|nr:DUF2800 domain-containing protein [Thermoanaerobaculia bacterium]
MTDDRDERGGLASASSMRRIRRCPGSLFLSQSNPNRVDGSKDADEGVARHSLIEIGADAESIDDSNTAYTVEQAKRNEAEAIRRVGMEGIEPLETIREVRLWVHGEDLQRVTSARLDLAFIWESVGLIVDHKTLFGDHGHAKDNEQLLTQVVALCENHGVTKVYVALSQPNLAADKRLTFAEYDWHDIQAARRQLLDWCAAANRPDAPRNPGDWCVNCPGRSVCKEAIVASVVLSVRDSVELSSPEKVSWLLDRCELAEGVIKGIRDGAKKMIGDGVVVPGWELTPGNTTKKITKPQVAFGVVAEKGATEAEFIAAVTVKKGELEKLYHAKTGGTKKAAAEQLEAALKAADAIEEKQNQPSLSRIK